MSKLSKRNLKGGKSSRKRTQSRKRRTQRGGALNNQEFAQLLDLILQLTKPENYNPRPDDNQLNGLLVNCSFEQLLQILELCKNLKNIDENSPAIGTFKEQIKTLINNFINNK